MGYANAAIHHKFEELSSGPDDPIWVAFRNPKVVPAAELASTGDGDDGVDDKGKITDSGKAFSATHRLAAKLVIAVRAYDARHVPTYDDSGEPVPGTEEAPLLPRTGLTEDDAAGLPSAILNLIMKEVGEANNPAAGPGDPTGKKS